MNKKEEVLSFENVQARMDGRAVFSSLYFPVYKSETVGIVFDHIIEKKCLLDILKGLSCWDSGTVLMGNQEVSAEAGSKLLQSRAVIIDKTSKLIDSLTIPENVLLFSDSNRGFFISSRYYSRKMATLKNMLAIEVDENQLVKNLPVKDRVILELMKAFVERKKLIVLSDFSDMLKGPELAEIIDLMGRLKSLGTSFIIVESISNMVINWIDRLVIIFDGRTAGIFKSGSFCQDDLRHLQTRNLTSKDTTKSQKQNESEFYPNQPALSLVNVSTSLLQSVNLYVKKGEILKVIYFDDPSFTQMIDLLKGYIKPMSGKLEVNGKPYLVKHLYQSPKHGVCFIDESPIQSMLHYNMSVIDNIRLPLSLKMHKLFFKTRFKKNIQMTLQKFMPENAIYSKMSDLSLLELQQVTYLKWLLFSPSVVICIRPFADLDLHLAAYTRQLILQMKSRGIAVIILTANIAETENLEGRRVFLKDGRIYPDESLAEIYPAHH